MRVQTSEGALRAAILPGLAETSMRVGRVGEAGAKRRARVDTGEMRDAVHTTPLPNGGARVQTGSDHDIYNEYGTSRMSAKPFVRPSMDDCRGAL